MKFFEGIKTLEDLRKEYRRLAILNHPDKGGDTATMQEINNLYDRLSKILIHRNPDFTQTRKDFEYQVSEELKEKLSGIVALQGIEIELIGSWIWVTGNTFPVRETLKNQKFMFSRPKMAWYWHAGEYRKKNGKIQNMDEMRNMWGSTTIENESSRHNTILN